jgi:hypothetical protein
MPGGMGNSLELILASAIPIMLAMPLLTEDIQFSST